MRHFFPTIVLMLAVCAFGAAPWSIHSAIGKEPLPRWHEGVRGDFAFETCDRVCNAFYTARAKPPRDWQNESAATRVNRLWEEDASRPWFIEEQRFVADFVLVGVACDRADQIDRGLRGIEWGFRQMRADGSFDCGDNYHSASLFVEAAAHALLILDASRFGEAYRVQTEPMRNELLTAARWLAQSDVQRRAKVDNQSWKRCRPYTHRRFLVAAALGEAGVLCNDAALIEASKAFFCDGLASQREDGAFPEKGGHDSHYDAVGLIFAMRYDTLVADDALRAESRPVLEKGFAWLMSRIAGDGTISDEGNTRTGLGQECGRSGKLKKIDYPTTERALLAWAYASGDEAAIRAADRVAAANVRRHARR